MKTDFRPVLPISAIRPPYDTQRGPLADEQPIFLLYLTWNFGPVRENCGGKSTRTFTGVRAAVGRNLFSDTSEDALGIGYIGAEITDDHLDSDRFLGLVPGIVIGGASDGGITEFGLTCQFCFRQSRHADEIHTPAAVDIGLGPCGK